MWISRKLSTIEFSFRFRFRSLITERKFVTQICQPTLTFREYATPTLTPTNRPQVSKIAGIHADISEFIKDRESVLQIKDSVALNVAQVCYANMPSPL